MKSPEAKIEIVYRGCLIPPHTPLLKPYEPTYTKWQIISSILKIFAPLYISVLLACILISWPAAMMVLLLVGLFYVFVFVGINT